MSESVKVNKTEERNGSSSGSQRNKTKSRTDLSRPSSSTFKKKQKNEGSTFTEESREPAALVLRACVRLELQNVLDGACSLRPLQQAQGVGDGPLVQLSSHLMVSDILVLLLLSLLLMLLLLLSCWGCCCHDSGPFACSHTLCLSTP